MHPMVPVVMTLGVILFVVGIIVYASLGAKKAKAVKFFGKEYRLWSFVAATVGLGTALIMLSVLIPKYIDYQPEKAPLSMQPLLSSNLKYELDAVLNSLNLTSNAMTNAIGRFQVEYQAASQKGEKNAMELLVLELGFRIRTELQNQNYPEAQIERDVERVLNILKQSDKQANGK